MKRWQLCSLLWIVLAPTLARSDVIRVGIYENPPKAFSSTDGLTAGLFPDVLADIALQEAWEIAYIHGTKADGIERLENGGIDLLLDIAPSQEQRDRFIFTNEPVVIDWDIVHTRKNLDLQSLESLSGKSVAIARNRVDPEGPGDIKQTLERLAIPCQFIEVDSYKEVLMLLDENQVDVGVVNQMFAALSAGKYDVKTTPILLNPSTLHIAGNRNSELAQRCLARIDQSLGDSKRDPQSRYNRALNYYLSGGLHQWDPMDQLISRQFRLSPEERDWLEKHPTIRIAIDPGFAPFEFLDDLQTFQGMAADYLSLISQKLGVRFELVSTGSWSESLEAIRQKEVDMLPCLGVSEERRKLLNYSKPYLKFSRVIITPITSSTHALTDLSDARVGVQINSSHHAFLEESTRIRPVLYQTFEDVILALSKGELDAGIGNLAVATHTVQNLSITNLKLAGYATPEPQALYMGIRNDWPVLKTVINRALDAISTKQRNVILSKWLPLPRAAQSNLDLTQQEREWLLMHPRIRVAWDTDWAPLEFADKAGKASGISMDYLRALENLLGITFDTTEADVWKDAVGKLERRELDMASCVAPTAKRLQHLYFTDPYMESPVVIFSHKEMPYIQSFGEITDLHIAIVQGYALEAWLDRDYPDLNLTRTTTVEEALEQLRDGQVDAYVGNVIVGNYYLSQIMPSHNIEIVGETPYTHKLHMAVRKDWPIFAGILQKSIKALPEDDRTAFYRNWVWLKYEHGFNYSLAWKIVLLSLAVVAVVVYWNRRLAAEVASRKKAEKALSQSEQSLRLSYDKLKDIKELKDNLTHMIVHDMRSPISAIRGALELVVSDNEQNNSAGANQDYLLLAQSSSLSLLNMVQSMLDVVRLESDEIHINPMEADLREIATNAIAAIQVQAKFHRIQLVLSGDPAVGTIDPEIIQRVLINLMENAIKASPENSSIEIFTSETRSHITAEIQDHGSGIPHEFQDKIFDKFASVEAGPQRKLSSVGLGLAFCKLAIEAHGGVIAIDSTPGKGSMFRIQIPKMDTN